MRSQALVLSIALLAGCASSPALISSNERISTTTDQSGGNVTYFTDVSLATSNIDIPIQQAWPRLLTVYQSMGIPITTLDSAAHIAGAVRVSLSHQIGKRRISYDINCGSTLTGVAADSYRVSLTVLTQLQPMGSHTAVRTSVSASARDQSGTSTDPVQCGSTGALEHDIASALGAAQ